MCSAHIAQFVASASATASPIALPLRLQACLGIPQINDRQYDFRSISGKE
jgi:hypothetical protein